jgi:hypothetical protein
MQFQTGVKEVFKMKSLVFMNYAQPTDGIKFRWGVKLDSRDTKKKPLALSTLFGPYRRYDKEFQRTRNLITLKTNDGIKAFYAERTKWKIEIPWIGSLVSRFM